MPGPICNVSEQWTHPDVPNENMFMDQAQESLLSTMRIFEVVGDW
jgi:hypothetical protein